MSDALQRLIDAVEDGEFDPPRINDRPRFNAFCDAWEAAFGGRDIEMAAAWRAYSHFSLDAAMALLNVLLGADVHWSLAEDADCGFCAKVYLGQWFHEHDKIASRAFLLAILRAYQAQEASQ